MNVNLQPRKMEIKLMKGDLKLVKVNLHNEGRSKANKMDLKVMKRNLLDDGGSETR